MEDKKNDVKKAEAQVEQAKVAQGAAPASGEVYAKIIRGGLPAGKVVVTTREGDSFLAKEKDLEATAAWQPVSRDLLEDAPYDFAEEIAERMPTVKQIQLALLRQGILRKSDLTSRENQTFFNNLFPKL